DLIGGFGIADRLERFVGPAAGELFDRRNRIFGLGIDGVSRAEFFGLFQLFVDDVDDDDRIGAEAFEKLDRIEPDPTAADDQRGIAAANSPTCLTALYAVVTRQPITLASSKLIS